MGTQTALGIAAFGGMVFLIQLVVLGSVAVRARTNSRNYARWQFVTDESLSDYVLGTTDLPDIVDTFSGVPRGIARDLIPQQMVVYDEESAGRLRLLYRVMGFGRDDLQQLRSRWKGARVRAARRLYLVGTSREIRTAQVRPKDHQLIRLIATLIYAREGFFDEVCSLVDDFPADGSCRHLTLSLVVEVAHPSILWLLKDNPAWGEDQVLRSWLRRRISLVAATSGAKGR